VVTGDIVADLFASTSGTDSDWIVKLIDVLPENKTRLAGYQLMIAQEIFRGRYRNSFTTPAALVPDAPAEYKIDLHMNDHAFLPGHRIMVQVQSTWFPVYDRNPQAFVSNIYEAHALDYVKATQRVYHSPDAPSSILLPVASQRP
jgi:putative CocE/NonD family hydrolase